MNTVEELRTRRLAFIGSHPHGGAGALFLEGDRDTWTKTEGDVTTLSRNGHETLSIAHELIRERLLEGGNVVVIFDEKLVSAVKDLLAHVPTVAGVA